MRHNATPTRSGISTQTRERSASPTACTTVEQPLSPSLWGAWARCPHLRAELLGWKAQGPRCGREWSADVGPVSGLLGGAPVKQVCIFQRVAGIQCLLFFCSCMRSNTYCTVLVQSGSNDVLFQLQHSGFGAGKAMEVCSAGCAKGLLLSPCSAPVLQQLMMPWQSWAPTGFSLSSSQWE